MDEPLKVVVTSVGRSGTKYMARLLTSAGMPCEHESVFSVGGIVPNGLPADSSWLAAPFLESHPLLEGAKVVHCVRNPWRVLRSIYHLGTLDKPDNPYYQFMVMHLQTLLDQPSHMSRCVEALVGWQEMIELAMGSSCRYVRFHVEDDPKNLLQYLGLEFPPGELVVLDRKLHTRGPYPPLPEMSLDDFSRVRELCRRYKYPLEEPRD